MGMVNARLRLRMKELTDNEEKTWKEIFNPAYEVRGLFPPPFKSVQCCYLVRDIYQQARD